MSTLPYETEARRLYEIEYAITPGEPSKWPGWKDLTTKERAAWRKFAEREATKSRVPVWPSGPIRSAPRWPIRAGSGRQGRKVTMSMPSQVNDETLGRILLERRRLLIERVVARNDRLRELIRERKEERRALRSINDLMGSIDKLLTFVTLPETTQAED